MTFCYADRRESIREPRVITLPIPEITAIGDKAIEDIPMAHNRKRRDARIRAMAEAIEDNVIPGDGYAVGDMIAFRTQDNEGTRKWTDIVCPVRFGRIERMTDKTVFLDGRRVNLEYVLGKFAEEDQ